MLSKNGISGFCFCSHPNLVPKESHRALRMETWHNKKGLKSLLPSYEKILRKINVLKNVLVIFSFRP